VMTEFPRAGVVDREEAAAAPVRDELGLAPKLVMGAAVAALLLAMGIAIPRRAPSVWKLDVWFGADVSRHVAWVCGFWYRAHLHPISAMMFRAYGRLLRVALHDRWPGHLVVYAFPVIGAAALVVTATAAVFARSSQPRMWFFAGYGLAALAIGPVLVFGPIPESHLMGGAALAAQALLLLRAVRLARAEASDAAVAVRLAGATVMGGLAAGFTLTNALPALALFFFPLKARIMGLRSVAAAATAMALMVVVPLAFLSTTHRIAGQWGRDVQDEGQYSRLEPLSVPRAFRELVVYQFGVPFTTIAVTQYPPGHRLVSVVPAGSGSALSWAAFLLWSVGIAAFLRARKRGGVCDEKHFAVACLAALATMVAFHSVYNTREAYLFSAHAWPYVLLTGLVAFEDAVARGERTRILLFAGALALAAAQTAIGERLIAANLSAI